MKYKDENCVFLTKGYYVSTVDKNNRVIAEYIKNQLQENIMINQIKKEFIETSNCISRIN